MEFQCICQLFRSMESALECGFSTQCHSIEENWFSLSQQLSLIKCFLARSGTLEHFSFSMLGFCLTKACAGLAHAMTVSVSSYVHPPYCICKNAMFLKLFTTSDPYNFSVLSSQRFPKSWKQGCDKDIPFMDEYSKSS